LATILRTKLYIPRRRPDAIRRPRLVERLNAEVGQRMTLVSAPAGFGKTTLLAEWIPTSARCVTWVSLDAGDSDPALFWGSFFAALRRLDPTLGRTAQSLLESSPAPNFEVILAQAINDISDCPLSFVHVFDDYHFIENQEIDKALAFLLEHLPPNMNVVIASRADPTLPLARWRGRGQLVEIRAAELRFTPAEVAAFLRDRLQQDLAPADIATLENRTEGWAAGLQLAALSLQGRDDVRGFIEAFSGSHRHVLSYLAGEVLDRQPPAVLDFLLQTSILDQMCAPLCETVTGMRDSQSMLERIEQFNLFVVPLDDEGRWYRYHHLFAGVLQRRLRQSLPDLWPDLHRRASLWHEHDGSMTSAVRYALEARDLDRAADLVEAIGMTQFAQPAVQYSLQGWLAALPERIVRRRPQLHLIRAWQLFDQADISAAIQAVADAERAAELAAAGLETRVAQNLHGAMAAMRAFLHTFTREPDLDQVLAWADGALADLEPDRHNFRGLAAAAQAFVYAMRGGLDDVVRASRDAVESARAVGNVYLATFAYVTWILILRAQGRFREALAVCREALEWMASRNAQDSPSMSALNTALADLLREFDDLDGAQRHASLSLQQADIGANPTQAMFCRFALARIMQARGDWEGAFELLAQVSARLPPGSPMLHPALIPATTAQWELARGRLAPALRWAQATDWEEGSLASIRTSADLVWRCEHLWIARAQTFIVQGRAVGNRALLEEARAYLVRQQAFAEAMGLGGLRIKVLLLQAVASQALGDAAHATVCLELALSLAQAEGLVRLLVDEGEALEEAIALWRSELYRKEIRTVTQEHLLAYADRLLEACPVRTAPPAAGKHEAQPPALGTPLVEPLREREREVLHLIAQGYTNQEIASKLVVGLSTVKTHINHLFQKLGVASRTQAVARARELGLLDG
jgi:LuxR family maltose regulon positive regulatory protein